MDKKDRWIAGALLGLLLAASVVMAGVWRYKTTPGASAPAPRAWPENASIARETLLPTVLVFLHPRCPCSVATLEELRTLTERFAGQVRFVVWVAASRAGDEQGRSWDALADMEGVERKIDLQQQEAHRFGAMTSGHVVAFAANGTLIFSGGITGSRGHAGANEGEDLLTTALVGSVTETVAPTFGCAMEARR